MNIKVVDEVKEKEQILFDMIILCYSEVFHFGHSTGCFEYRNAGCGNVYVVKVTTQEVKKPVPKKISKRFLCFKYSSVEVETVSTAQNQEEQILLINIFDSNKNIIFTPGKEKEAKEFFTLLTSAEKRIKEDRENKTKELDRVVEEIFEITGKKLS